MDEGTYLDAWIRVARPRLVAELGSKTILVRSYVPARDAPRPASDLVDRIAFPGFVSDAALDALGQHVLALVDPRAARRSPPRTSSRAARSLSPPIPSGVASPCSAAACSCGSPRRCATGPTGGCLPRRRAVGA